MTPITRRMNEIKLRLVELIDELSAFFKLIICLLVEAGYIYIFERLHEPIDRYVCLSPRCPIKFVVLAIGIIFFLLNIEIVIAFFLIQSLTIIRGVKSAFAGNPRKASSKKCNAKRKTVLRRRAKMKGPQSPIMGGIGIRNVTMTMTVVPGSNKVVNSSQVPSVPGRGMPDVSPRC